MHKVYEKFHVWHLYTLNETQKSPALLVVPSKQKITKEEENHSNKSFFIHLFIIIIIIPFLNMFNNTMILVVIFHASRRNKFQLSLQYCNLIFNMEKYTTQVLIFPKTGKQGFYTESILKVPGKYRKLYEVDTPVTEFLFGDNLDEKVDKLDKDDKRSDKLSMESGGVFFREKKAQLVKGQSLGSSKRQKLVKRQILAKGQILAKNKKKLKKSKTMH